MKIIMASDHAGVALKLEIKALLTEMGHEVEDMGPYDTTAVDLSDFVYPAALKVSQEKVRGIFVDGVGYGSALIANRIYGIDAVVCQDPFCAKLARQHTDSNVLCLGGKIIGSAIALDIVNTWMTTDFLAEEKYIRRVEKVKAISEKHLVKLT
ncbi:MAG: RpiB/LacA/LacB family sugar-phosphate isomerase [Lactococcus sp.]|jgi:ribose 5-phosphate isomerase B|uniref:Sugar phosphate isomerase YwlF n=1 Tax=Pseudolactococcus piscium MKFS47 TaxID=297352 RepID=A0A0D6DYS3_9LACT|nr:MULTISPECIES: RpiB/LacA/LacB family sugar-phosphate isomerase [Lactococcus]MBR6895697.1 RpiB/LacA/LacB family sugar-phosphate isomerase [Lactococcus sp.]MCJ1970246.1 RpiB/LacA/LacB family sugar-phosphate isomerase [Lactococcus carnosus]MDN5403976.1 RpiB/LacA/LacB family sugar-phosphate isomerase [Lactococcus sp.]MDN5409306.1 RpiB/LacA/LacB family sugar-phosphate isomerase [Lactococcus sp.]MDN5411368.1 RpiB/LacA/LacB family sugar-phosphate isomerase [Lactococcus sp.]